MKTKPMNPRSRTLFGNFVALAILVAFAVPAAHAGSGLRDDIVDSFAVKPGGTLTFDSDLANLEITTSETETLRAEFTREFKVSNAQEADALRQKVDIQMAKTDTGAKITVRWTGGRNDRDRQKVRVNFQIAMPRKFNLDLRTIGSGKVDDLNGTVKALMVGGSLKLKNVSGPVSAKTEGGSLSVDDVGGDLEANAEGGSIDAGRVSGHVLVLVEGGSVSIKEATEWIEAKAEGGSVAAYISKQPRGDSKLVAEAGNVELRLPESIAINIDAACSAGQLRSDFSLNGHQDEERLKGKINGGGPLVMVRASAGNINVHK